MAKFRVIFVALILIAFAPSKSFSGDYEDGFSAYVKGDFETALKLWKPLFPAEIQVLFIFMWTVRSCLPLRKGIPVPFCSSEGSITL